MVASRRWTAALAVAVMLLTAGGGAVAVTRGAAPGPVAFLARADNPVDALAASSVAAQMGGVVLLTDRAALSAEARDGLLDLQPDLVVLAGGEAALSAAVEQAVVDLGLPVRRVAGTSRLGTAQAIAAFLAERPAAWLPVDGTAVAAERAVQADTATTAATAERALTADRATAADTATVADTADLLGGLPATAFGPITTTSATGDLALTGGILNSNLVLSMTVVAPADGMLLVDGGAVLTGNVATSMSCEVHLDNTPIIGASSLANTDLVIASHIGSCDTTGAVAVTAGTHTLALRVRVEENGHRVNQRDLLALFSPSGAVVAPAR